MMKYFNSMAHLLVYFGDFTFEICAREVCHVIQTMREINLLNIPHDERRCRQADDKMMDILQMIFSY